MALQNFEPFLRACCRVHATVAKPRNLQYIEINQLILNSSQPNLTFACKNRTVGCNNSWSRSCSTDSKSPFCQIHAGVGVPFLRICCNLLYMYWFWLLKQCHWSHSVACRSHYSPHYLIPESESQSCNRGKLTSNLKMCASFHQNNLPTLQSKQNADFVFLKSEWISENVR